MATKPGEHKTIQAASSPTPRRSARPTCRGVRAAGSAMGLPEVRFSEKIDAR